MRPLSSDMREFIHLLRTNSVKYVIVGAWLTAILLLINPNPAAKPCGSS